LKSAPAQEKVTRANHPPIVMILWEGASRRTEAAQIDPPHAQPYCRRRIHSPYSPVLLALPGEAI
jgi:hypothetical protein